VLFIWERIKFQQYIHGRGPLNVQFNDLWHTFTLTAGKGGQAIPIQADRM